MGYGQDRVATSERGRHGTRQLTSLYAVMLCVFILLFLQFLLLAAALDGYLGGKQLFVLPTVVASGVCCALACKLIGYVLTPR